MPTNKKKLRRGHALPAALAIITASISTADEPPATPSAAAPATEALAFNCYTCHAAPAADARIPTLTGMSARELLERMLAFKQGEADATIMQRIAKGYSDAELARIADYLAQHQ